MTTTVVRCAGLLLVALGASAVPAMSQAASPCATPRPEWLWCDDFEADRLRSYFEVDTSGGRFVRTPGAGRGGSVGMRAQWDSGQVSVGFLHLALGRTPVRSFRPVDDGRRDHTELYWRLWVRHEPGWRGGGPAKLSRAFVLANERWAQAMIAHVWSGSAEHRERLAIDPASGTRPGGALRTTRYNDFANLRWLGVARSTTPVFADGRSGTWMCVEAHVRLNQPGTADGLFELWVDDRLEARRSSLDWRGTYSGYGLNAVYLENFWNQGARRRQARVLDDFVVSTERIGCGVTPVTPQPGPAALRPSGTGGDVPGTSRSPGGTVGPNVVRNCARAVMLGGFVVACGGDGGPVALPPFTVTPAGGTFVFPSESDSLLVISVPAGAVSSNVTLQATLVTNVPAAPTLLGGTAVELLPSMTFNAPVSVSIRYNPAGLPTGVRESELSVYKVVNNAWVLQSGITLDTVANRVTASVLSFSTYGILGAPVATVTVTPPTPSVQVAGTTTLTATVRDAANTVLPSRAVSWSSGATGTATVNGTGTVTGVAAGTAVITATSEGVNGTATVTVTAQPPPPGPFNEPAGFTLISDRNMSALGVCGVSRVDGWDDIESCPSQGGNITIINDASAPLSQPGTMQMRFPNAFGGGSSPAVAQRAWALGLGYTKMYYRHSLKVSANFEGHPSTTNKIHHMWVSNPAGNRVFTRLVGTGSGALTFEVALQGVPDARTRLQGNRNGGAITFNRDQWYTVEILVQSNTGGGANGIVRAWINGTLRIEYTDVQIMNTGESTVWSQLQFSPTWGGGGGTTTREFYMWVDHTYISGQP